MPDKTPQAIEIEQKLERYHDELPAEQKAIFEKPRFKNVGEERLFRKQRLAAAFRIFDKFGFSDGVAGHITARDPRYTDHFWVNPLAMHFGQISVSDLILVNQQGEVVEGEMPVNPAAFGIHSAIHHARPDVVAVAHAHAVYGRAWSSLGKLLDPITQDACAFYEDHIVFNYDGPPVGIDEGRVLAESLGNKKAAILVNHGLLTVGTSVDECAWWYISMERSCQAQLMAEAAGTPKSLPEQVARTTREVQGNHDIGWFNFMPLWQMITREQPDLLD